MDNLPSAVSSLFLQAFCQCSTLDLTLPMKSESATDGFEDEGTGHIRGTGFLSFALDSCTLDKYDIPASGIMIY